jgi:hypothetical protein
MTPDVQSITQVKNPAIIQETNMQFLEQGNFNGLIFRDGMVFISDIDKWVTMEEYNKYKNNE